MMHCYKNLKSRIVTMTVTSRFKDYKEKVTYKLTVEL